MYLFEELIGRSINWSIREGLLINTFRSVGHKTFIYDTKFVVGAKYKQNGIIYYCVHVDKNGTALLSTDNKDLGAFAAADPTKWEAVY